MEKNVTEINLGGCYHTNRAYTLGYYANGELELHGELFTNLDTGLDNGALAELKKHRSRFCEKHDIKRFIVALKPVEIIEIPDQKSDPCSDTECSHCKEKEDEDCCCHDYDECDKECDDGCDRCGGAKGCDCDDRNVPTDECICRNDDKDNLCDFDSDESCFHCGEDLDDCECDYDDDDCDECGEDLIDCVCDIDIAETFSPMNAFARARWNKAQQKGS